MSRWLKILLVLLVATGALLATLPWWLGGVLRPVLRGQGITYQDYQRVGYTRFELHDVAFTGAGFKAGADRVQTVTPLLWLWQRARGAEPDVTVERWRLVRSAAGVPATAPGLIRGLPDLRFTAERLAPQVIRWLPRLRLASGEVSGYGPDFTVAVVAWRDLVLTVEGLAVAGRRLDLSLTPTADGTLTLTGKTAENDARLRLVLTGPELKGEAVLWDQPLHLAARFPDQGWLPTEASAVAENWRLPAARVKLGAPYSQVWGGARLVWRDGSYDLTLDARAEPAAETKNAPPFTARAAARGTLRELTLSALAVDAPFATARLTAPVTFSLDRPLAAESARLTVKADLAKLPWLQARGQAEGTVTVTGGTATSRQEFALKFSEVIVGDVAVKSAQARGALTWPQMELTELSVQLDEAGSLKARGGVNWQTRELTDVSLEARLGGGWFGRWLPAGSGWENGEVTATAEGPLSAPRHTGAVKFTGLRFSHLNPLALEAAWQGAGAKAEITALVTAGDSTLAVAGTLERHGLRLARLKFAPDGGEGLELSAPAHLAWAPVWQVDALSLAGTAGQLTLTGRAGPEGSFAVTSSGFASAWLQDWITLTGPAWQVSSWRAEGQIDNAVLVFTTALTARIEMSPQPAEVSLIAQGDARGVELQELKVVSAGRVLTQATGRLPLAWLMTPTPHLRFDETGALELSATTAPDSPLWATLASTTGLELADARARAELKGTLRQPTGELQLQVARLAFAAGDRGFSLPEATDLSLAVQFGREQVTLTDFSAKLDGQPVQASGKIPMDDAGWLQVWRAPRDFDWSRAEARLAIPDADLAPFARRIPALLAARGRVRAEVELTRGRNFSGTLDLSDVALRPLPPLGTLQEIQAKLTFENHTLTVRSLTGTLGGEPVSLDGTIALEPGQAPRLALGLKGKNLPLVRNTGLLLRTDLDLQARTDAAGVTHLSGAITVRDCLVLASLNLRTLLPSGRRGVERQPPYFSVEAEPFRNWPLAVVLRAPSSIRVRTTVYSGLASAHFRLGGTLGEPRAVGELTVDEGQVLFPFATFTVQQGAVRLREADPFHAVVGINATSQRRDYQLRLEMTGELPTPNLVLSSTPAMDSADVLLMVMTGQIPASEATAATASSGARLAMLGAYLGRGLFQDLGLGGEDRLEISAGERISRDGRETYEFEYKLGGRWSLQGEYDQFDSYNAGLKWRAYTEESVPDEKK